VMMARRHPPQRDRREAARARSQVLINMNRTDDLSLRSALQHHFELSKALSCLHLLSEI
jgi:hypothetical protein